MKIAYIMRGIAGSGKSTVAKNLAGSNGVIHSTDEYRYVDGEYKFDPDLNEEHHQKNLQAFTESIKQGVEVVVCDNTNSQKSDWQPYVKVAKDSGYIVAFVTMPHLDAKEAAARNTHQVPADVIQNMLDNWEPL